MLTTYVLTSLQVELARGGVLGDGGSRVRVRVRDRVSLGLPNPNPHPNPKLTWVTVAVRPAALEPLPEV